MIFKNQLLSLLWNQPLAREKAGQVHLQTELTAVSPNNGAALAILLT